MLWALAFALMWVSPKLIDDSGFEIAPAHFVERHGLVLIIAIGESIIAVGAGAADLPVDLDLAIATLLGLGLAACLWWSYFGSDEEEAAEHAIADAPMAARPRLAINAFGYAFLFLLLGVIAIAAALKELPAHPFDELKTAKAVALGGGVALFLLGEAWFRQHADDGLRPRTCDRRPARRGDDPARARSRGREPGCRPDRHLRAHAYPGASAPPPPPRRVVSTDLLTSCQLFSRVPSHAPVPLACRARDGAARLPAPWPLDRARGEAQGTRSRRRQAQAAERSRRDDRRSGLPVDVGDAADARADRQDRHHLPAERRQLPALLPLPGHLPDRPVRAQPRRHLEQRPRRGLRQARRQRDPAGLARGVRLPHRPHRQVPERVRRAGPVRGPQGWSEWYGGVDPSTYGYYDITINHDGKLQTYGSNPHDYSTDVYSRIAARQIRESAQGNKPFFLNIAPNAPHTVAVSTAARKEGTPAVPAPRDSDVFADTPLPDWPNLNEADITDKPALEVFYPDPLDADAIDSLTDHYDGRMGSLLAVDDLVANVEDALRRNHVARNTVVIYTSDNGWVLGEHRLSDTVTADGRAGGVKYVPYEASSRVPLMISGPGFPAGRKVESPTINADLTSTVLDVADTKPGLPQDGISLRGVAHHPERTKDRAVLTEAFTNPRGVPALQGGAHASLPLRRGGWRLRRALRPRARPLGDAERARRPPLHRGQGGDRRRPRAAPRLPAAPRAARPRSTRPKPTGKPLDPH